MKKEGMHEAFPGAAAIVPGDALAPTFGKNHTFAA